MTTGVTPGPTANYQRASDLFDRWRDDLLTGKPPVFYPVGTGALANLEVGPGLVSLFGGAPGGGKTALTMQFAIDALRLTPTLRALVCNVEMGPDVLLDRQLARLAGVDAKIIRYRKLGAEHADRIDKALVTLADVVDRLCFVRPPFDLGNVAATADDFSEGGPLLMLLDYIQRIAPGSPGAGGGGQDDHRGSVNATMDYLRQFADAGVAVVVVSAVGRTKDNRGRSSYAAEGLNLASFRESSELEFGADDAFILAADELDQTGATVNLKHLKSRHGEALNLRLDFDRARQRFTAIDGGPQ